MRSPISSGLVAGAALEMRPPVRPSAGALTAEPGAVTMSDAATVEEDTAASATTPLRERYLAGSPRLSLLPRILLNVFVVPVSLAVVK